METVLIMLVTGTLNVACFFVGAKVGQKVQKDETLELPEMNPMKLYREHREQEEIQKNQDRINIIMENIDNYDGTGLGQMDVPK